MYVYQISGEHFQDHWSSGFNKWEGRDAYKFCKSVHFILFFYKCKLNQQYSINFFYIKLYTIIPIRKTCPCNIYPLIPHFYIAKLGFAGVYLFFLFLLQNIDCGYSLEPPRRGGSNVYPQSMFGAKTRKISKIFS